ncbi:MAG: HD domain-containing protein [Candidatus Cloacimonetes bacterium]|nr:HD domain-containing protein [Candidatus Cloacimonadota bacterium]
MEKVKFDLNQFLQAVSFAIDFVEIDILGATENHSRRVAYISLRIAEKLGLSKEEKSDIVAFSIMHDNGLCEESLHTEIQFTMMKQLQRMEGLKDHCIFGERNIKDYPLLSGNKNIVKYHHENWDGTGFFGLKGNEIPLLARIIGLADFVDNVYHFETGKQEEIKNYIKNNVGIRFAPEIVSAYLEVSSFPKFWLDLKNETIWLALKNHVVPNEQKFSWQDIFEITRVFTTIIDSKSRFTGRHSTGIIEKTTIACDYYQISGDEKIKMMIAASLHDLGKLAIPDYILEKPAKLNVEEMNKMKSHTYYTKFALRQIDKFDEIREWAANHHEKLNGTGYPEGLDKNDLEFNCRLMACIDIYQALTEDRPYRKGLSFDKSYSIMDEMAENNFIDRKIVEEFIPHLSDKCNF